MIDEKRETWTNQIDFFLSALGYAVGFGAIWRFPYLTFENGGGAFLIPYLIMFLIVGLPIFFIEMTLGQYSSSGPVRVYQNICPLFGGVGTGMVVNSFIIMLYYNMILAWTIYYLYTIIANIVRVITAAMRSQYRPTNLLDWATCNPEWSSPNCIDLRLLEKCRNYHHRLHANDTLTTNMTLHDDFATADLCRNVTFLVNATTSQAANSSMNFAANHSLSSNSSNAMASPIKRVSPSEDFFYRNMLEAGNSISDWSWPVPQMLTTLTVAWIIAFICLARGIKMSGKIVWVTSTFPYLFLVILLIRGAFLPGAGEGVRYFIQPAMKYLLNMNTWVQAASMILFLLSVGGGGLATYASYNTFHNNIYRDSILISCLDVVASFLGGFCVFSYIGFIAHMLDQPVPAVTQEGTALLFIALPEATTQMPASVIWALALCIMMLMLGMDTQFAFVETCVTALSDEWPKLREHKPLVLSLMCLAGLIFGFVFTLRSGLFWLNLIDYYVGGWPLMLFSLCEVIVIIIYGVNRFSENMEVMTGKRFGWVFKIMWWFITPIVLTVLLVLSCMSQAPLKDSKDVPYPLWAQAVGWALVSGNVAIVPLYAIYALLTKHRNLNLWQRFKVLLRPTAGWQELDERAKTMDIRVSPTSSSGASTASGGGAGPGDEAFERHAGDDERGVAVAGKSGLAFGGTYSKRSSSGYNGSLDTPKLNGISLPSESSSSSSSTINEEGAVSHRRRNINSNNTAGFQLQQLGNDRAALNGTVNDGFTNSNGDVFRTPNERRI